jgi:hypothetical protein
VQLEIGCGKIRSLPALPPSSKKANRHLTFLSHLPLPFPPLCHPPDAAGLSLDLSLEYADPTHTVVLLAYIMRRRTREQVKVCIVSERGVLEGTSCVGSSRPPSLPLPLVALLPLWCASQTVQEWTVASDQP